MKLCVGSRLSSLCGASWRALTRRFAAASSRGRGGKMNYWICTFRTLDETQNERSFLAAGQGVFYQVVNMIEIHFVDARQNFEGARRLIF